MTSAMCVQTAKEAIPNSHPIIVVGTGPVGIRAAQELRQRMPTQPLTLFGGEPWQPYDRIKLSSLLAGELDLDEISLERFRRQGNDHHQTQHLNCPILEIDRTNQQVKDVHGQWHHYSKLILAVGSHPHIPKIAGTELKGVYTFRNLNDAQALMARTARARHVVVIGGGLLGLEAAKAMLWGNTRVTVVQQGETLMNRQLDKLGGSYLQQSIEQVGIDVLTGNGVREIRGVERVEQIVLRDGTELTADTVIVAAGITPNRELALAAHLPVGHGIRVNDQLQTEDPNIYAVGECAEHGGVTYGLVAPGYEQAAVAAEHIAHQRGQYVGSLNVTALKVVGEEVFSMGEVTQLPKRIAQQELVFQDNEHYRKIVVHKGRLVGAISVGPWSEVRRIQEHVRQKRPLSIWQQWRFKRYGNIWPDNDDLSIQAWPAEAIVCNCMNISKGQLVDCVNTGCQNLQALSNKTGAGTVCGSCKPLLQEVCGSQQPLEPVRWSRSLALLSLLCIIGASLFTLFPSPISESVQQGWWLEQLWRDGTWKQVSGFTILGLSVAAALLSLRKRIKKFTLMNFEHWRLVHTVVGALIVSTLLIHTGLSLGSNLNRWLMISFLALLTIGCGAAIHSAISHKLSLSGSRRWQKIWLWGHILAFWPLPVLLTFHVLSVYYF
ncbi:NAD(P)/FAD-dependent oxidoreductase [Corallincola luteus]|uniref:NAD(P)/FAD-dependent oxidoreductase n=1 Tax=Corallincola luteus TaxID=1775177 RepID=A0ABY2ANA7_9GAMM|nr:FAD-dependent oxidoreductase [Corallincola luteus]TCI04685.1 NAD(P)/FAD-dependent oxidoreductase [Corallincola luteus]